MAEPKQNFFFFLAILIEHLDYFQWEESQNEIVYTGYRMFGKSEIYKNAKKEVNITCQNFSTQAHLQSFDDFFHPPVRFVCRLRHEN